MCDIKWKYVQEQKHDALRRTIRSLIQSIELQQCNIATAVKEKYIEYQSATRNSITSRVTLSQERLTLSRELGNKLQFFVRQEQDNVIVCVRFIFFSLSLFSPL